MFRLQPTRIELTPRDLQIHAERSRKREVIRDVETAAANRLYLSRTLYGHSEIEYHDEEPQKRSLRHPNGEIAQHTTDLPAETASNTLMTEAMLADVFEPIGDGSNDCAINEDRRTSMSSLTFSY
jgi:hypothetical protein